MSSSPPLLTVVGPACAQGPRSPPAGVGLARAHSPQDKASASSSLPAPSGDWSIPPPSGLSSPAPTTKENVAVGLSSPSPTKENFCGGLTGVRDLVFQQHLASRPTNTIRAIDPKIKEWEQFCDNVYPKVEVTTERYRLTADKTYQFMLYQAMRPKKERGGGKGKKRKIDEVVVKVKVKGGEGFNVLLYNQIMKNFSDKSVAALGQKVLAHQTQDPLGFRQFCAYKAALIAVHRMHISMRLSENVPFEPTIWGPDHVCLMNVIKNRKHEISESRFDEKMGSDATPYTQVDLIPKIETSLWNMGYGIARSQLASLRNRHAFLMTTSGIMRFESLAKRNLSEIFSFTWRGKPDVHDILITMFQLPTGKFWLIVVACCLVLLLLLVC